MREEYIITEYPGYDNLCSLMLEENFNREVQKDFILESNEEELQKFIDDIENVYLTFKDIDNKIDFNNEITFQGPHNFKLTLRLKK